METERILSADSHVIEPADVWTARIEKRFLDRTPRVGGGAGSLDADKPAHTDRGARWRYPKLKMVSVENDIGWIPHFIQRMDHSYEKYRYLEAKAIPNPPSFYFHRRVQATFQDDRVGMLLRDIAGVGNLMWASDFPHSDSTWPNSRDVIARDFAGVPD
jgi:hypothetical protein